MKIWGHKTEAMFDLWSIKHFLMGIALTATAYFIIKIIFKKDTLSEPARKKLSLVIVLLLSISWEMVEHYLEQNLFGKVITDWFAGTEHWTNRIFGDNLLVLLGWFVYHKNHGKILLWFEKIFSFAFLFVHIVIFPNSMYLHDVFGIYTLLGVPIFLAVFAPVYFLSGKVVRKNSFEKFSEKC